MPKEKMHADVREFYHLFYYYSHVLALVLIGLSVSRIALFHVFIFLAFAAIFKRMSERYS